MLPVPNVQNLIDFSLYPGTCWTKYFSSFQILPCGRRLRTLLGTRISRLKQFVVLICALTKFGKNGSHLQRKTKPMTKLKHHFMLRDR